MTAVAMILMRLAYDDMVRECKERNKDFVAPDFEKVIHSDGVVEHAEQCADRVKDYLYKQYTE